MNSRMKQCMFLLTLVVLLSSCAKDIPPPQEPETLVMPSTIVEQFNAECSALMKAPIPGVPGYFMGRDGWSYQISELRYGACGPFFGEWAQKAYPKALPEDADPLNAILHFRNELKARGIELVIMPIPVRPIIYPEGVIELGQYSNADTRPHIKPMQDDFLKLLREAGISEINLTPYFLGNLHHERGPLYCKSDTHWTPVATALAADIVSEYIKTRPWYENVAGELHDRLIPFESEWLSKEHFGHAYKSLRDMGGFEDLPNEVLSYRKITGPYMHGSDGKRLRHPNSAIIVLGDSNMLWWQNWFAAFPHELAFELGFHVDTLTTRGGGVNQARINFIREARKQPEYLEGKKLLLWTFSARGVLEAKPSWIKTPLQNKDSQE